MPDDNTNADEFLWRGIANRRVFKLKISQVLNLAWLAVLSAGLIYVFIEGVSGLLKLSVSLNLPLLVSSVAVGGTGLVLAVLIWRRILARYKVYQLMREDMRIYCYAALGFIIPGGIWTVVGRSVMYSRLGANGVRVAVASVVESFVIGIASLSLYILLILLKPELGFWQNSELTIGFALILLCALHPRVFNWLLQWILNRSRQNVTIVSFDFGFIELLSWIVFESIVILLGGVAMFILLSSVFIVPTDVIWRVIAGYAAASAVANLFFWLPGTLILRDGAMFLSLAPSLPLPAVLTFLALARIWMIASMLCIVIIIWLILDRPRKRLGAS